MMPDNSSRVLPGQANWGRSSNVGSRGQRRGLATGGADSVPIPPTGWQPGLLRQASSQAVVFIRVQDAAVAGGGAPAAQRAVQAGIPEDDSGPGDDPAGDPGWAGHGPGRRFDGEVIAGEAVP